MNIKQEKITNLLERRGYLTYLVEELHNSDDRERSLIEIEKVIDEIIEISVDLTLDFPNIKNELIGL